MFLLVRLEEKSSLTNILYLYKEESRSLSPYKNKKELLFSVIKLSVLTKKLWKLHSNELSYTSQHSSCNVIWALSFIYI